MHSIYIFFLMIPRPPRSTLFPYRRSSDLAMVESGAGLAVMPTLALPACLKRRVTLHALVDPVASGTRSEEHTSELQSLTNLVCRLLLEKKKKKIKQTYNQRHVHKSNR